MSQALGVMLFGMSGLLIWAGFTNKSPVAAVKTVLFPSAGGSSSPSSSARPAPTAPAPPAPPGYGPGQGHGPSGVTG